MNVASDSCFCQRAGLSDGLGDHQEAAGNRSKSERSGWTSGPAAGCQDVASSLLAARMTASHADVRQHHLLTRPGEHFHFVVLFVVTEDRCTVTIVSPFHVWL